MFGSLDELHAVKNFYGKSLTEARLLFEENDIHYLEDLLWMGTKAFSYYVVAAIDYLKGESSRGSSDAVNILFSTISFRLDELREEVPEVIPTLREAVLYILNHWKKYDADSEIYRDLKGKYSLLLKELKRSGNTRTATDDRKQI